MKKIIAVLMISILLVTMIAPAFAKPGYIICPICDRGELISITQTPWQYHCEWYLLVYTREYEDCYETITCTAGTHGPYHRIRNERVNGVTAYPNH